MSCAYMSALADNPYMVDAQFQSDNRFTQWLSNKRQGFAKPEVSRVVVEEDDIGNKIKQLHVDVRKRAINMNQYNSLRRKSEYWSSDIKNAKLCLYECLYNANGLLYHGHSILHDIHRDEKRKALTAPSQVMCRMYECGFENEGSEAMWVPKKGAHVLWRIKSFH